MTNEVIRGPGGGRLGGANCGKWRVINHHHQKKAEGDPGRLVTGEAERQAQGRGFGTVAVTRGKLHGGRTNFSPFLTKASEQQRSFLRSENGAKGNERGKTGAGIDLLLHGGFSRRKTRSVTERFLDDAKETCTPGRGRGRAPPIVLFPSSLPTKM